jgi:SAM-dependent methyltransferase
MDESETRAGPAAWLLEHAGLVPRAGTVLDVACGRGRHALYLASMGLNVWAIDRDPAAIAIIESAARARALTVDCAVVDLETNPPPDLGQGRYDAVLVFNYLHRPLFPALRDALRPGGRLFYETFTIAQAARGRPTNPDFLLRPGELPTLVAPLTVLHSREGEVDGRCVASVIAER